VWSERGDSPDLVGALGLPAAPAGDTSPVPTALHELPAVGGRPVAEAARQVLVRHGVVGLTGRGDLLVDLRHDPRLAGHGVRRIRHDEGAGRLVHEADDVAGQGDDAGADDVVFQHVLCLRACRKRQRGVEKTTIVPVYSSMF